MRDGTGTISNKELHDEQVINEIIHFASTKEISVRIYNENVTDSIVINHVTVSLSKSADFQDLIERRAELEDALSYIPAENAAKRLEISARLNHQKNVVREFVHDVLTLAAQFKRSPIDTERLRRARGFFERGEFREARAVFETDSDRMRDDQEYWLSEKEHYETRVVPNLINSAEEYLMFALATQTDYANPRRYESAREKFELSIRSHANDSNVFYYAYFLANHKQYAEAEKYYRRYLDEFPQNISPADRAMVLNNLANLHTNLDQPDEALREYDEALRFYRTLAVVYPEVHLPDVAMTLNNQGVLHKALNRYDEAFKEYDEALRIYRKLAASDAQAAQLGMAQTLNNLANLYNKYYKYDEAGKEYLEALRIYRSLAAAEPKAHRHHVAQTLNNLAVLHKSCNKLPDAAREYAEALQIFRDLAVADPQIYLPYVTETLINLANLHQAEKNFPEALREYDEALRFYRSLAEVNRDAYRYHVATTLNNLAVVHKVEERFDEAARASGEALEIYRELAAENPEAFQAYVGGTLNNLATIYHAQNKPAAALRKYEETLEIRRALYRQAPAAYALDLAATLMNLAMFYQSPAPDREKSVASAIEAITLIIPFRQTVPATENYMQICLAVLMDWGLTDIEIQQLTMEKVTANANQTN
jgi:tetratricopeptide (TPR) repeat protein